MEIECGHVFHKGCLLLWFDGYDYCPYEECEINLKALKKQLNK